MVAALPSIKAKLVYHQANLSALATSNMVTATGLPVTVSKAPKPNLDRPEFYYTELKVDGGHVVCGELSILDFLARA